MTKRTKGRDVTITGAVTLAESELIRNFCAQFDTNMMDLVRELVLWAMDNAPIEYDNPVLVLGDRRYQITTPRELRGAKPGDSHASPYDTGIGRRVN